MIVVANGLAGVYCLARDNGEEFKFLRSNGSFAGILDRQPGNRIVGFQTVQEVIGYVDQHSWAVSNRFNPVLTPSL